MAERGPIEKPDKKDKKKKKKSKYTGWFSSKGNKSKVEIAEKMEQDMILESEGNQ